MTAVTVMNYYDVFSIAVIIRLSCSIIAAALEIPVSNILWFGADRLVALFHG